MARPTPTTSSPNDYDAFFRQAQEFASRIARFEGVVGVLLTGGAARGYADHFSELDLAVYLARPCFEAWTGRGLAPFPEGDSRLDGWHVDFDYFCYEDESQAEWEHVKRWDRSYAAVLYDPQGLMREMLARQAVLTAEEKQRLKAVYLANDELVPFDKWTLNLSYTLPWTPPNWQEWVEQTLLVREVSRPEIERRCALLRDLFAACKERLVGGKAEGLEAIEARKLEILRYVRAHGAVRAAEFAQQFGLRRAIQSPLFYLLRRETREGEEWLTFDEGRLQEYAAQDFDGFLGWDRELLRAVNSG